MLTAVHAWRIYIATLPATPELQQRWTLTANLAALARLGNSIHRQDDKNDRGVYISQYNESMYGSEIPCTVIQTGQLILSLSDRGISG